MSGRRAERDATVAPSYAANPSVARLGATNPSLLRLERLARLLDRAVGIPGTRVGFGLDPLLGLVPGFGDVATGALSLWIILEAARLGAPRATLVRMLGNVAVDTLGGTVPLVGDLFDVAWRSNMKNVALLREHAVAPAATERASKLTIALVSLGVLALVAVAAFTTVWLVKTLAHLAS